MTTNACAIPDGIYPGNSVGRFYFASPLDPDDTENDGRDWVFEWDPHLPAGVTISSFEISNPTGGLIHTPGAAVNGARDVQVFAKVGTAKAGQDEALVCKIIDSNGVPITKTGHIRIRNQ